MATIDPMRIPRVKNRPIKVPTCSLESSGALEGALIAHWVLQYPLVNEKIIIFTILNQSEFSPKSQEGATSLAINTKVAIKITLA